jgi:hypothetical protein
MLYKIQKQTNIKDTPFMIAQTVFQTDNRREWKQKIREYNQDHWVEITYDTATVLQK